MRIRSVVKLPGIRTIAACLVLLGAPNARAAAVAVDREQLLQLLQTLTQQIASAQQQIDQAPNAHVQLVVPQQQLQAVQRQIGELLRQISMAPPAPAIAPQYAPPAPQYPPQYPQAAPQYPQAPPQYPQAPPQYPQAPPQYPQAAPQYPQAPPQYPQAPEYAPPPPTAPQAPPPNYQNAISDGDLRSLLQQITGASSNEKLNLLRQSIAGNSFLVDQVARVLPLYVYTSDRVIALQILAPQILDRQNSFKLLSLFRYSDDRDQAQRILGTPQPPR